MLMGMAISTLFMTETVKIGEESIADGTCTAP